MSHDYDVSVCGTYILDILGVPVTEIPPGGTRLFIDEIRLTVAGTAGGTALPCGRLGLRTLAVGAVGSDEKADWLLGALTREGIDVSGMDRLADVPTSATILPIRPDGSRPALHAKGASRQWRISPDVQAKALRAKVLHFGGVGSLPAMDGANTAALLGAAKAAGCITTLDLIMAGPQALDLLAPSLPLVDFFMPSIEETASMVGTDDPAACARFFIDRGVGACAISRGGDGSFIMTREGRAFSVPAFEISVRDTTGCGDAYTAGFIAGLVRDWDLKDCARLATATAALVATGLGSGANVTSFDATVQAMNSLPVRGTR